MRLHSAERGGGSESDSDDSNRSPSPSPSSSSSFTPLKKGSKEWRIKEQARQEWHDKSLLSTPVIAEEPVGDDAQDDAPLEKGVQKPQEKEPLKKGTTRVEVKKEAQAKTPLEKGASSGSAASSAAPGKPVPHVMVDYHNVLSIQNGITPERSAAMVKLLDAGVKVTVCSWCFQKRAKQVMAAMKKQPWFSRLTECCCIEARTGPYGKDGFCKEKGCQTLMDDSKDILQAALEQGIEIFPIATTRSNQHDWWLKKGGKVYLSFEAAVDEYLLCLEEEQKCTHGGAFEKGTKQMTFEKGSKK